MYHLSGYATDSWVHHSPPPRPITRFQRASAGLCQHAIRAFICMTYVVKSGMRHAAPRGCGGMLRSTAPRALLGEVLALPYISAERIQPDGQNRLIPSHAAVVNASGAKS
eukprot:CAMPEP_0118952440 /NCGR_PEP_ID=MMETSP1169-20130426/54856_1 /TAXON_ID=36882 /ORGANISM="Pyramimonas obovata, Strain CCMP722" /LENGTH=109 /DNA_ID=CAMNT_0006899697 /DNA_START=105 /DNA_END=434 /DNA_ORIENTATION=+